MFFKKKKEIHIAHNLYQKIISFSRNKIFYTKFSVPDTIDGRFDVLTLLIILIVYRLSFISKNGSKISQFLFDLMFQDLDYSLRELGAGDAAVTKNMRKFISSYMGRQKVYINTLKKNDYKNLEISIQNNIFRNSNFNPKIISSLTKKIIILSKMLSDTRDEDIISGNFEFII